MKDETEKREKLAKADEKNEKAVKKPEEAEEMMHDVMIHDKKSGMGMPIDLSR